MPHLNDELLQLMGELIECGAIEVGDHALKRHEVSSREPISPVYVNLRTADNPKPGPVTPEVVEMAAQFMAHYLGVHREIRFDYLAGLPFAGEPFVEAMARCAGYRLLKLEKMDRDGRRQIVGVAPGSFRDGETVLLFNETVTHSEGTREGIAAIERAGLVVRDVFVLVDREQGGTKWLREQGYRVHAFLSILSMLPRAVECGRITAKEREEIEAYLRGQHVPAFS